MYWRQAGGAPGWGTGDSSPALGRRELSTGGSAESELALHSSSRVRSLLAKLYWNHVHSHGHPRDRPSDAPKETLGFSVSGTTRLVSDIYMLDHQILSSGKLKKQNSKTKRLRVGERNVFSIPPLICCVTFGKIRSLSFFSIKEMVITLPHRVI